MNFSKSKVLLKKINAIHDSADSFDGKFSTLEKDLMLQYLRDLYECIAQEEQVSEPVREKIIKPENKSGTRANFSPSVSEKVLVEETISESMPNGQEKSGTNHAGSNKNEAHPKTATIKTDPDLEHLFGEQSIGDLSQKFANAPIDDLSRAMGINERILTINELFKGNQQAFQEVALALNELSSFGAAKKFLIEGIAKDNEWASKKKREKAMVFIKLVRRRYL